MGVRGPHGDRPADEIPSEFPTGPEYYDRLYGPRRWTSAVALNLAIGQGENAQTLAQMVRLVQQLASDVGCGRRSSCGGRWRPDRAHSWI